MVIARLCHYDSIDLVAKWTENNGNLMISQTYKRISSLKCMHQQIGNTSAIVSAKIIKILKQKTFF